MGRVNLFPASNPNLPLYCVYSSQEKATPPPHVSPIPTAWLHRTVSIRRFSAKTSPRAGRANRARKKDGQEVGSTYIHAMRTCLQTSAIVRASSDTSLLLFVASPWFAFSSGFLRSGLGLPFDTFMCTARIGVCTTCRRLRWSRLPREVNKVESRGLGRMSRLIGARIF